MLSPKWLGGVLRVRVKIIQPKCQVARPPKHGQSFRGVRRVCKGGPQKTGAYNARLSEFSNATAFRAEPTATTKKVVVLTQPITPTFLL